MKTLALVLVFLMVCTLVAAVAPEDPGVTPDSFFWGIDKALDNLDLRLTRTPEGKSRRGLEIAQERLLEIRAMGEESKVKPMEKAKKSYEETLLKVQQNIREIEKTNTTDELEDVVEVEKLLEEHDAFIGQLEAEFEIKIESERPLTEDEKQLIDAIWPALKNQAGDVRVEIGNKKNLVKIKIKQKTGMTDIEVEEEVREVERRVGLVDVLKGKADVQKRMVNEMLEEIERIKMEEGTNEQTEMLLEQAKAHLANADKEFGGDDYGEAYAQSNAAWALAKNALRMLYGKGPITVPLPSPEKRNETELPLNVKDMIERAEEQLDALKKNVECNLLPQTLSPAYDFSAFTSQKDFPPPSLLSVLSLILDKAKQTPEGETAKDTAEFVKDVAEWANEKGEGIGYWKKHIGCPEEEPVPTPSPTPTPDPTPIPPPIPTPGNETCTNGCTASGENVCSGNGYKTCGNYDTDSCLEWSSVTNCASGKSCVSGVCVSNETTAKELLAYWSFDEGSGTIAYDESGNGYDGTVYGATWVTGGISGGALSFDGNDYVNAPDVLGSQPEAFTVMAWAKTPDPTEDKVIVAASKSPGGYCNEYYHLWIHKTQNQFYWGVYDAPFHSIETWSPYRPDANTWYHVTGIIDGEHVKMYINGNLVATNLYNGSVCWGNVPTTIGKKWNGNYWNGLIDEVKIYNYALSASEVQQEYEENAQSCSNECSTSGESVCSGIGYKTCGNYDTDSCLEWSSVTNCASGKSCVSGVCVSNETTAKELLAYWSFDEGSGTIAYDESGNGYDGTVYGSPNWVTGISGYALEFERCGIGCGDDYISAPNALASQPAAITVMAWAQPIGELDGGSDMALVTQDRAPCRGDDFKSFALVIAGSDEFHMSVDSEIDPGDGDHAKGVVPLSGNWYHVTGIYDGNTIELYVNGELSDTKSYEGPIDHIDSAIQIGKRCNQNYWNGLIDEVKIYNYALSASEVQQEYQANAP